jgi:hypothetical protein
MPPEAAARLAAAIARSILRRRPDVDRVSVLEGEGMGREVAVATRREIDRLPVPDQTKPIVERRVA